VRIYYGFIHQSVNKAFGRFALSRYFHSSELTLSWLEGSVGFQRLQNLTLFLLKRVRGLDLMGFVFKVRIDLFVGRFGRRIWANLNRCSVSKR
jgi:hypothetical protein